MKHVPGAFRSLPVLAVALAVVAGLALAACGGGSPAPARDTTAAANTDASSAAAAPAGFDFPTGPAVTVPVGYEPPGDRVDSTGAHLPANGKPTLVFVDAIW